MMDEKVRESIGKKVSTVALAVNVSLMLLKAFTGIAARSTAIIADAFNNGTDILATIAVFGGLRIAYRPPDEKHHYGHEKAEPIVSKIVGLIVGFTGLTIGYNSVKQIISGTMEKPGSVAIVVSFLSIFIKYFLYKYTNKAGKLVGSSSIVADSYNHRSDVLASSAALIGVAGARFGFPVLDPIAGLMVSIIIFRTGVMIYLEAVDALMDTAPDAKVLNKIKKEAAKTYGVIQVNDLKARKVGSRYHVDLKICVDGRITVEEGHYIAAITKQNIIKSVDNVQNVMVHVNPCYNLNDSNKPECNNCDTHEYKNNRKWDIDLGD